MTADDLRRERAVEQALINHVSDFLLEMGKGFAYVGRQVRLLLGGEEFFCNPSSTSRRPAQHPASQHLFVDGQSTVGLLLCQTKNNVVTEYALRGYQVPIGIAEYTNDITTTLPDELTADFPTIAELEAELAASPADSSTLQ